MNEWKIVYGALWFWHKILYVHSAITGYDVKSKLLMGSDTFFPCLFFIMQDTAIFMHRFFHDVIIFEGLLLYACS